MGLRRVFEVGPRGVVDALRHRASEFQRLRRAGRVVVGTGSYGAPRVETFAGDGTTRLVIGNYCSVASTATFLLGGNHPTDRRTTFPVRRVLGGPAADDGFPSTRGDIVVGHGAWIAHEALVLSGVTIGAGAVVAARAVVAKDVPAYAVVAGNPARVVSSRLSPEVVAEVEASRWWELSPDEVVRRAAWLNDEVVG